MHATFVHIDLVITTDTTIQGCMLVYHPVPQIKMCALSGVQLMPQKHVRDPAEPHLTLSRWALIRIAYFLPWFDEG